jgi:sulfotransferase family protein
MAQIELRSDDGSKLARLDMPAPDGRPTVLASAFLKSGSVMLDGVLRDLCAAAGRAYVRLESGLFAQGLHLNEFAAAAASLIAPRGFVFGVFRTYLPALRNHSALKKIILIRDPRDVAVSWYYSIRNSHALPKTGEARAELLQGRSAFQETELNAALLDGNFDVLFEILEQIAGLITLPNTVIYRYEDIVFDKPRWVRSLAANLAVQVPGSAADAIAKKFDIFPESENPDRHIRKVTPGDYKEKLWPEAITYVEQKYQGLLRSLSY